MSKDKIPLLAHEKIKLAFWIVVIVAFIIVPLVTGLWKRVYLAIARDEEGYNVAISEVCDFYRVQIIDYDDNNILYKLSIAPTTWDSADGSAREKFMKNCKAAFDKMMHRYHITAESDDVDLMVYKNQILVASVINGFVNITHNLGNDIGNAVQDATHDFISEFNATYDGIMDDLNKSLKEIENMYQ